LQANTSNVALSKHPTTACERWHSPVKWGRALISPWVLGHRGLQDLAQSYTCPWRSRDERMGDAGCGAARPRCTNQGEERPRRCETSSSTTQAVTHRSGTARRGNGHRRLFLLALPPALSTSSLSCTSRDHILHPSVSINHTIVKAEKDL